MKKSGGGHVNKRNVEFNKDYQTKYSVNFKRDYQLFATSVQRQRKNDYTRDFACQCCARGYINGHNSPKREEVVYYSGLPKQVFAYSRSRSFTNVGVGSVIVPQKKRVRKIYLPETENKGVGSSELFLCKTDRKLKHDKENAYYCPKNTSSKCVGGTAERVMQVCNEKLSPIMLYNKSKGTSPIDLTEPKILSKDIGNNTIGKNVANTTTQVESTKEAHVSSREIKRVSITIKEIESKKSPPKTIEVSAAAQKSSDSLEQHVHNLEEPSYIQSTGSSDLMENKLEKEYRKIFSRKNKENKHSSEKPIQDLKSTSLLRRRFEALKRGKPKKEEAKKGTTSATDSKDSNPVPSTSTPQNTGTPTHRDISVESDPPSLEARSYSHTKMYSPAPSTHKHDRRRHPTKKKSYTEKKERDGLNWPPKDKKKDSANVKGMFEMWEKKFNFDEDKKIASPVVSVEQKPTVPKINTTEVDPKVDSDKKEGKRFFFFKKKSKDKAKPPPNKKGVTAGRCEVKNCLVLNKHSNPMRYQRGEPSKTVQPKSDDDEIIKKNWLKQFIQRTIESRKSLQIRWNNKAYATSSSTVFELMDHVYRDTEVIIRSQSETSTVTSSYYESSYHKQHVNFVQDIEAWMVPKLIPQRDTPYKFFRTDGHSRIPDRKWFIDKSKAFAHEIELVLHSKNFLKCQREISSDYLRIDIPKGFFTDNSSESAKCATSNSEEVYKIVEYESPESRSDLRFRIKNDIGDYSHNEIVIKKKVSVRDKNIDTRAIETVIKKPPTHRDVVIQGSNVFIPKRCDVIGVGIITHRVNKDYERTMMRTEDEMSEEESEQLLETNIKQCQFAESYLREYYRTWMPLGIDLFTSSCASDFHIKCESDETVSSIHNQGDGTKSCPNISNDYNSIINLDPSSISHGSHKELHVDKTKIFNTFKSTTQSEPPLDTKRVLPKDSFEVLRKRMLYAFGQKSTWNSPDDKPYSVPSLEDKAEQDGMNEVHGSSDKTKKNCKKHVSITNCDTPPESIRPCKPHRIASPIADAKPLTGILSFSRKSNNTKHATVEENDVCEIQPPACKEHCEFVKSPACSKSPSKKASPSSCSNKSCPPPPPCIPPLPKMAPQNSPPRSPQKSPQRSPQRSLQRSPRSSPPRSPIKSPCPCKPKPMMQLPKIPQPKACSCSSKESKTCTRSPQKSSPKSSKVSPPSPPLQCPCSQANATKSQSPSQQSPEHPCPCSQVNVTPSQNTSQQPPQPPCPCVECFRKNQSQSSVGSQASGDLSRQGSHSVSPKPVPATSSSQQLCPDLCKSTEDNSTPKIQGLHLKMKPATKCASDPQAAVDDKKKKKKEKGTKKKGNKDSKDECLECASDEKIMIRVKKETESTEEIRDGVNVKVQDADGKTLFERRDYKADCGSVTHKSSLLGDMYKVNRLSTATVEHLPLKEDSQDYTKSIANLIEISFGLKVVQGDKITEMNLRGDKDEDDKGETKCNEEKSQDVFMMNSEVEPTNDDINEKNDINIKIVIKNFKSKPEKPSKIQNSDEFSKKISQKFHTVSTGHSDVLADQINNMYSIHRTTIDLTTSKSEPLPDSIENGKITIEHNKEIDAELMPTDKLITDPSKRHGTLDHQDIQNSFSVKTSKLQNSEPNEIQNKSKASETFKNTNYKDIDLQKSEAVEYKNSQNNIGKFEKTHGSEIVNKKSYSIEKLHNNDEMLGNSKELEFSAPIHAKKFKIGTMEQKSNDNNISDTIKKKTSPGTLNTSDYDKTPSQNTKYDTMVKNSSPIKNNDTCVTIDKHEIDEINYEINDNDIQLSQMDEKISETNEKHHDIGDDTVKKNKSYVTIQKPAFREMEINENHYEEKDSMFNNNITSYEIEPYVTAQTQEIRDLILKLSTDKNTSQTIESESHYVDSLRASKYEDITELKNKHTSSGEVLQKTDANNNEAIKIIEHIEHITTEKEMNISDSCDENKSDNKLDNDVNKTKDFTNLQKSSNESEMERQPTYKQLSDTEGERKTELESENEHSHKSEMRFSHTDTDDQDNIKELTMTSDDAYEDASGILTKPSTRREKKEMLKHVFEKATTQKWKSKGRMKRLKNMLKFILTSDSSEGDEAVITSKELIKDVTYSTTDPISYKDTDSLSNYYKTESVTQSDEDNKMVGAYPTQIQSMESKYSDSSNYQVETPQCLCNKIAERLIKRGDIVTPGCCCKSSLKVHEQTSCDINKDREYMINYKTAEYMDVETQHSTINSRVTNVMLVKQMESAVTSMNTNIGDLVSQTVSPYREEKECEAKNAKTNTMLGILDEGKIVIQTSNTKKSSLQTEIIIGWKGKEKKKHTDYKNTYFTCPADILQSYQTKKAVLEIYTEKTVTEEGERLVAKLPKFVYDKEQEIENSYVNNVLLTENF